MPKSTLLINKHEFAAGATSEKLLPIVYEELRKLATQRLAQEQPGQTLQATALVHEAWLRLVNSDVNLQWDSHGHFFSAAAEAMRRILIDRARQKSAQKRNGRRYPAVLDNIVVPLSEVPIDELLDLDDAIGRLGDTDPEMAEFVKLRIYVGLTVEEAAANLNIAVRTAYRTWALAKAWLYRDLNLHDSQASR
ncbi:ECF-type sigma factor [Symmachiella dynata]|uniref:ECF-type sigma factor n=1 Tax=Symmachiella dynata TaxID=2527995 RepID=UPI0030EC4E4F|tara:strand:+ start:111 stop:689 length:579 start_codon:yes stop_codon:yes gene_type:complete